MKKKIYLATEKFPYSEDEKPFIQFELAALAKKYDITIMAHANNESAKQNISTSGLPLEIKVVNCEVKLNVIKVIYYFFRYVFDVDGLKEIVEIFKSHKNVLLKLYQSLGFYCRAMENWKSLTKKDLFSKEEEFIYYSFWYTYYTYSMTKHKKIYKNAKVITRAHGFDLYDERYACGRQPFKKIMDAKLDMIIFACDYAKRYYENRMNSLNTERYIVSKIGTKAANVNTNMRNKTDKIIVSCSKVVSLKRVHLIIEALSDWSLEQIEWHHFGDGEEFEKIKKYASERLNENSLIHYYFHGNTHNEDILQFYANNEVMCFITTSSTEGGAPVSIQEAMAYGIPIIGTDVGGITEMIQGNGILLSGDPEPNEIKSAIEYVFLNPDIGKGMGDISKKIWNREYCANVNVQGFLSLVEKLS